MRYNPAAALALIAAATVALAGCTASSRHGSGSPADVTGSRSAGSSSSPVSTPAIASSGVDLPTPSSSISATSTATQWTTAEAKLQAKQIIGTATDALTQLSHVSPNSAVSTAQQALKAFADADQATVKRLADGAWPTSVRAKVNAYIAALDSESRTLASIARLKSVAAMQAAASQGQLSAELTQVQASADALTSALG